VSFLSLHLYDFSHWPGCDGEPINSRQMSELPLLDIPPIFPPRLNSHILPINTTTYEAHKMLDERAMEAALAEMNAALVPNASAIAKKYSLERTTLKKRFLG
jgi:hypothetical protein